MKDPVLQILRSSCSKSKILVKRVQNALTATALETRKTDSIVKPVASSVTYYQSFRQLSVRWTALLLIWLNCHAKHSLFPWFFWTTVQCKDPNHEAIYQILFVGNCNEHTMVANFVDAAVTRTSDEDLECVAVKCGPEMVLDGIQCNAWCRSWFEVRPKH